MCRRSVSSVPAIPASAWVEADSSKLSSLESRLSPPDDDDEFDEDEEDDKEKTF